MADELMLLTPKNLYRFLTGKMPQYSVDNILTSNRTMYRTLVRFWSSFLDQYTESNVIDTYFNVAQKRSRVLSNIMNRTEATSARLLDAMMNGLSHESFLLLVTWVENLIVPEYEPLRLHQALNAFQEDCLRMDVSFKTVESFFVGLRPKKQDEHAGVLSLRFLAAYRIAWMGVHAFFGKRMNIRELREFRTRGDVQFENLWAELTQRFHQDVAETARPAVPGGETLPEAMLIPELTQEEQNAALHALILRLSVKPESDQTYEQLHAFCGWYIVSNWTEKMIALNSQPFASYDGAKILRFIPNGAILYVHFATNYNGLNNSKGCWGYTVYSGWRGFVPMNMLQLIGQNITVPEVDNQDEES